MKTIWQELPKPFFILAPMEDVTDHIFRRVVARAARPDLFFSEFTNATGWVHAGEKATGGRLFKHPDENYPLTAQIWGGIPEDIAALAQHCKALGYRAIDINMGCPVKHAIKVGGGSALIRSPDLAAEVVAAAKTAGLPVSVKTRLGYSKITEWEPWIGFLLKQDIAALTVHLRTKQEMSKVPAHWELMPEIKKLRDEIAPETLLIGNGDIADRRHGQELIEKTGIDGIMFGRGIFTNIFAFEKNPKEHSKEELLELLHYHLDLFEKAHNSNRRHPELGSGSKTFNQESMKQVHDDKPGKPYETLKRFFKIYIRDFPGSHELRNQLMQTKTIPEAKTILKLEQ